MKKISLSFLLILVSLLSGQSNWARTITGHESDPTIDLANRLAQPRARRCVREDLSMKEGETNAAMGGVRETPYIFTNISSSACTLVGYPELELLNQKSLVVRRATKQKSDEESASVTLDPGKTAWFNLNYNSGGAGHMGRPCPSYQKVRVTAPRIARPFVLRTSIQTCPKTDFDVTSINAGMPQ